MAAREVPVLVEDAGQPVELDGVAGLQHVVVVAVAVATPVHPADGGLAVRDEQLDVVDLVPAVVDRIGPLRHAKRIQDLDRLPAGRDGRVGDDPDLHPAALRCAHGLHQLIASQLVHLDQNSMPGRADQPVDQREDAGVLPQSHLAAGRLRGRRRNVGRVRAPHQGEEEEEQAGHSNHSPAKLPATRAHANPAC